MAAHNISQPTFGNPDSWIDVLPSFEQFVTERSSVKKADEGVCVSEDTLPSLATEVIGKPQLFVRRGTIQLDFSYIDGAAGDEFTEILGHKIFDVPPMTVIRVYTGEYGSGTDSNGRLQTGGLQQCIAKLDRALVSNYPVVVHVVHGSDTISEDRVISEPDWPGKIHVHTIKNFGNRPVEDAAKVKELSADSGADLIHLHITDSRLAALIAADASGVGLAVTFHNGVRTQESDFAVNTVRSTDLSAIVRIFSTHIGGNGLFKGSLEAVREITSKVCRRLFKVSAYAPGIYDRAAESAEKSRFSSSGLVSVSEHSQTEFQGRPSFVVGDPMDTELFNPAKVTEERKQELRRELGINHERVLICHGRVCELKGQQYLPEIAAELENRGEQSFKIIILGPSKDEVFQKNLKADIAARGLEERFILVDGRPNEYIRDVLAISDVMLFPTRIEALGGAGIEAGLMGVPVVGHHVGGVPEVVEHGKSGFLVRVGDTSAMAKHVSTLLADDALRATMGQHGRERTLERFDAANIATRYVELVYGPQILE